MKLKVTVLASFLAMFTFVKAQDSHIKEYASFLVEVEQSIDSKSMNRQWKKRKSAWEEETQTVNTSEELNTLSKEFISNLSTKTISVDALPKLKFTGDYEAYGKNLSKFAAALPQETTSLNSADFRTNVLAVGKEFKEQEMEAQAKKVKAEIKPDFTNVFQLVFEDAKKGSFSKIADSKLSESLYSVHKKMRLSSKAEIYIDEEKIYTYSSDVELTNALASSKDILKDMVAIILAHTPVEYTESEWIDETYVDRTIFQYEFAAEIFSVTAKKPTVAIGLVKKGMLYYAVWSVTEPVFKNWKQSNKDWNARDGK